MPMTADTAANGATGLRRELPDPRRRFPTIDARRLSQLVLAVLALLILATFADYGVSWDERVQNTYGLRLLSYYLTAFQDQSAFNYINLRYYGGAFDLIAASLNTISPFGEYETRHLLGGAVGLRRHHRRVAPRGLAGRRTRRFLRRHADGTDAADLRPQLHQSEGRAVRLRGDVVDLLQLPRHLRSAVPETRYRDRARHCTRARARHPGGGGDRASVLRAGVRRVHDRSLPRIAQRARRAGRAAQLFRRVAAGRADRARAHRAVLAVGRASTGQSADGAAPVRAFSMAGAGVVRRTSVSGGRIAGCVSAAVDRTATARGRAVRIARRRCVHRACGIRTWLACADRSAQPLLFGA